MRLAALCFALCLPLAARADFVGFSLNGTQSSPMTTPFYAIGQVTGAVPEDASAIWPDADTFVDELHCATQTAPGMGKSVVVTVVISSAGAPNTFVDGGFSCTISDLGTFCTGALHGATWPQDGSLSFLITPSGGPPAMYLQCSLRSDGNRRIWFSGALTPAFGNTVTAYGSAFATTTNDYAMFMPLEGTFGSKLSRLTCACSTPPGPGQTWNFRVRHWAGPPWTNSPMNCNVKDTGVACQDLLNTVAIGANPDGLAFRLTDSTPGAPSGVPCRCAASFCFSGC